MAEYSIEKILVGLDECNRDDHKIIKNTINVAAKCYAGEDLTRFFQQCLLIGFKRRNHQKALADGTGSGEKLLFMEIIMTILEIGSHNDLIISILPLVPIYGSWRDLQQMAIILTKNFQPICLEPCEDLVVDNSDTHGLHPVAYEICKLFADQISCDVNDLTKTPSNACKYVPHSGRNSSNKRKKPVTDDSDTIAKKIAGVELGDTVEVTMAECVRAGLRGGRRPTGRGGRGRGGARGGRGGRSLGSCTTAHSAYKPRTIACASPPLKITDCCETGEEIIRDRSVVPETAETGPSEQAQCHRANELLSREISRLLCPQEAAGHHGSAAFRKIRAALNARLVAAGHLLEPLLCSKHFEQIDFVKANKGTLTKLTAAIDKRGLKAKWLAAMAQNASAVNDIDSIIEAVDCFLREETAPNTAETVAAPAAVCVAGDDEEEGDEGCGMEIAAPATSGEDLRMFPFRLRKAVQSVITARDKIVKKAQKICKENAAALLAKHSSDAAADAVCETPAVTVLPVGVVIDTAGCASREQRLHLALSGYLLAQSQDGVNFVVVNGVIVNIPAGTRVVEKVGDEEEMNQIVGRKKRNAKAAGPKNPLVEAIDGREWLALEAAADLLDTGGDATVARLRTSLQLTLHNLLPLTNSLGHSQADVVVLCRTFDLNEEQQGQVNALLAEMQHAVAALQDDEEQAACRVALRTMRVHRVNASAIDSSTPGKITYQPRLDRVLLPPTEMSADILFLVDFTGSMSGYMSVVKSDTIEVINDIRAITGLSAARVAVIGYRDYQDEGRVVSTGFHPHNDLAPLVALIQDQDASGGGDAPEDLLSGVVCANGLVWQSDMRVVVIITDAEAHGYAGGGDHHPSGRCPDQTGDDYPDLPGAMSTLAMTHKVDTFFCTVGGRHSHTCEVVGKLYDATGGFGVVELGHGAGTLKRQLVSCLGTAIVGSITSESTAGLQAADGYTLSSLMTSLNASLRESLGALADDDDDRSADHRERSARDPETDYQRLVRELHLAELEPVRVALGMPLCSAIAAGGEAPAQSLAVRSAELLLKCGVTVSDLLAKGYPEHIVEVVRQVGMKSLKKI